MKADYINLVLKNPLYTSMCESLVDKYFDYIDIYKCHDCNLVRLFNQSPYIKLTEELKSPIGENQLYNLLKIKNRKLYNELKNVGYLIGSDWITFDKLKDTVLLKFDLSDNHQSDLLINYINSLNDSESQYTKSFLKVDITYLKSDIDELKLMEIIQYLNSFKVDSFEFLSFILTNKNNESSSIPIIQ